MASVSVRYIVDDVDAAIAFYRDHLGFEELMHPAPAFAMLRRGDLRLVLSAPGGGPGGGQAMPDGTLPTPGGWNRFALEVDDLDAAYEQLVASPWAQRTSLVLGPPEEWDLGARLGTRRVVNFTDPEGVAFQLVGQRTSRKATLHPFGFDAFPSTE